MSKDEGSGLLAKVVKFVRNPTTNWSALDHEDTDRESSYSKQMLKEMIERKRRNDFVRKREFDMLRKMRRSEAISSQDPAARPSFFQSSLPSKPDDRATTLKKIDEIEAQMSMQWWKTKHGDATRPAGMPAEPSRQGDLSSTPSAQGYNRTQPMPLAPVSRPPVQQDESPMMDFGPGPARAAPAAEPLAPPPARPALQPAAAPARAQGTPDTVPMSTGFTPSRMQAVQVEEFAHDPELEEAAIRFANGDIEGTEAGLKEVLGPGGPRAEHDETWLALFDLYRATGQQDRFEAAAIEFAGRFGRSAPQWFSMPEAVGRMQQPAAPAAGQAAAHWTSPASFGIQTLAAMNAALARSEQPWRLSWARLQSIEPAAVEPLTRQLTQWGTQPVQLRFIGTEQLEQVLREAAPSGDKRVDPAWWRLRMEALRVMHRPDEFELAALDYCVTYEVSPPSWESARCEFKPLQADGSYESGHTIVGEAFHDSMESGLSQGYAESHLGGPGSGQMAHVASVELAGQVLGDAHEAMELIETRLDNADIMVISCARLIRIDFTAAGTLLNWAGARQAEGRQVQFTQAHRLVAAFFNVIGISEHARVSTRTD